MRDMETERKRDREEGGVGGREREIHTDRERERDTEMGKDRVIDTTMQREYTLMLNCGVVKERLIQKCSESTY